MVDLVVMSITAPADIADSVNRVMLVVFVIQKLIDSFFQEFLDFWLQIPVDAVQYSSQVVQN